jgi:GntP family gluconate:H+ symporter
VELALASLLKISQGSSTVARITANGMLATMLDGQTLGYHPVYLASAVGYGSLVGAWMNNSGFWLSCRTGAPRFIGGARINNMEEMGVK